MRAKNFGSRSANLVFATLWLLACLMGTSLARAATITVAAGVANEDVPPSGDTLCSLHEAVKAVNDQASYGDCPFVPNGQPDRIVLPAGSYQTQISFQVFRSVEVVGAGIGATVVESGAPFGFGVRSTNTSGQGFDPVLGLTALTLRKLASQSAPVIGLFVDGGEEEENAGAELDNVEISAFNSFGILLTTPLDGFTASLIAFETTIADNALEGIRADGGQVELDNCRVLRNQSSGIATTNTANLVVTDTTIDGNTSPLDGGGIHVFGGSGLLLERSTVSNNTAARNGGGIFWGGITGTNINHVTISGNRAERGGGIYSQSQESGYFSPNHATIVFNDAELQGGGVFLDQSLFGGSLAVTNCIVAKNTLATNPASSADGTDIFGAPNFLDGSLIGTTQGYVDTCVCVVDTCTGLPDSNCDPILVPTPGGVLDPLLGPLQDLGGETLVHPLLAGSPAIDHIEPFPAEDQRGFPRPADGDGVNGARTDIGSFELQCQTEEQQLVSNQGFETNTSGWVGSFGTTITSSTALAHSGARSLRVANRNLGTWQGAIYDLLGLAEAGDTLDASGWVRIVGDPSEPVLLTRRSVCSGGSPTYQTVASGTATNAAWLQLSGTVSVPDCTLTELTVYFEGPRTGVILHVDDVSVTDDDFVCEDVASFVPLTGSFLVGSDWGAGYCVELRIQNPNPVPTTNWSASFNLNGTTIDSIWNLSSTGSSGPITVSPTAAWSQVIPAGGASHSLGFCATRPSGSSALPSTPSVSGSF